MFEDGLALNKFNQLYQMEIVIGQLFHNPASSLFQNVTDVFLFNTNQNKNRK